MGQFFMYYGGFVVFLHVLSALIWVGGMIAVRFAVHPVMMTIADPKERLTKQLAIVGKFFVMVIPTIFFLIVTALIMTQIYHGGLVHAKLTIWLLMTVNFGVMFGRYRAAKRALEENDIETAMAKMAVVGNYMIPVNIALGVIALMFGVTLRGL